MIDGCADAGMCRCGDVQMWGSGNESNQFTTTYI